jgi:hypothetical protein
MLPRLNLYISYKWIFCQFIILDGMSSRCRLQIDTQRERDSLVSCPMNTLLDPPAHWLPNEIRAEQGAPTRHNLECTGKEANAARRDKGQAQRVRYFQDRTPRSQTVYFTNCLNILDANVKMHSSSLKRLTRVRNVNVY